MGQIANILLNFSAGGFLHPWILQGVYYVMSCFTRSRDNHTHTKKKKKLLLNLSLFLLFFFTFFPFFILGCNSQDSLHWFQGTKPESLSRDELFYWIITLVFHLSNLEPEKSIEWFKFWRLACIKSMVYWRRLIDNVYVKILGICIFNHSFLVLYCSGKAQCNKKRSNHKNKNLH